MKTLLIIDTYQENNDPTLPMTIKLSTLYLITPSMKEANDIKEKLLKIKWSNNKDLNKKADKIFRDKITFDFNGISVSEKQKKAKELGIKSVISLFIYKRKGYFELVK